jgi:hypothetical protein
LTAGGRYQVLVEAEAITDETGDTVVSIGAGAYALIAAGAAREVDDQKILRLDKTLGEKVIEGDAADAVEQRTVLL